MGSCFSSITTTNTKSFDPPTAKIITLDGSLTEHTVPITASDVLGSGDPSCFLCNSDGLFFDADIPAMGSGDPLEPDQIYFVLPKGKLGSRVKCTDMADLAVKASSAIAVVSGKRSKRRRIRIAPVTEVEGGVGERELKGVDEGCVGILGSRSGWKTAGRSGSRRAGMVSRTCKTGGRLSTIEEIE